MATGDIFRLQCVWRREASPHVAINNLHYRQESATVLDTDVEDILEAFESKVKEHYLALVTDFLVLESIHVSRAPDFLLELVYPIGEPGAQSNQSLPKFTAGRIRVRTADFSRRGRSNIFLPPPGEDANTFAIPAATYIALLQTFADAVLTSMGTPDIFTAQYQFGMWSKADATFKEATLLEPVSAWSHQVDRANLW